jgi:phosphoribosylformimino-5-aminoimidazole carboxamide ribotide isomerase
MEIIPAIDIIDGKCVRLTQGDYSKKTVYNGDPSEVAIAFEDIGINRLHLVDLDGAKQGKIINYKTLEKIAAKTKLKIDFGGGIKTSEDVESVFNSGASIVTVGSIAVKNPQMFFSWLERYGADKILLGADVKNEKLAINGWLETTDIFITDFIKANMTNGVTTFFCTDISKDGLLQGPSIDLYKKLLKEFPKMKLIASGGVSNIQDVEELKALGCSGAIVGKAFYEGSITLNDLKTLITC